MRERKKPDLRLEIPMFPNNYVEMPTDTRRLILEANRTPNDIRYIDDETPNSMQSPVSDEGTVRSPTPEIMITGPEDMKLNDDKPNGKQNLVKRISIAIPYGLEDYEVEALKRLIMNNVSKILDKWLRFMGILK